MLQMQGYFTFTSTGNLSMHSLKDPSRIFFTLSQGLPGVNVGYRQSRLAICGPASWHALCELLWVSHLQYVALRLSGGGEGHSPIQEPIY